MVFHMSSSDGKSPLVSKPFQIIVAGFIRAVISIPPLISYWFVFFHFRFLFHFRTEVCSHIEVN